MRRSTSAAASPPKKPKKKAEPGLRARALRLLARREHTRQELARKLAPLDEAAGELDALLDDLTARGWLSDARVVEQVLHARTGRYGPARIRRELMEKGVPEDLIDGAATRLKAGELDAARDVWRRKFKSLPADRNETARQVRFLQARGFSLGVALRVVGGADDGGD